MAEYHLKVYSNKAVLVDEASNETVFTEGKQSDATKQRFTRIKEELGKDFLNGIIQECTTCDQNEWGDIPEEQKLAVRGIVDSISSEKGRGIVALTILQLSVKCIDSTQNIRLHKTYWTDGISLRSLDAKYNTPVLRQNNLVKLNADGFMMTRGLAENYPYSKVYKAALRGARDEWIQIVDWLENGTIGNPRLVLKYMLSLLIQKRDYASQVENEAVELSRVYCENTPSLEEVYEIIFTHIQKSQHSARLFEVAIHSMFQVLKELNQLDNELKPLSQMRSANKKHKNIGDIEIVSETNSNYIFEAWDAKYGKPYLYDELCELEEKLHNHAETEKAGFVVSGEPEIKEEIEEKISDIQAEYETTVEIISFDEMVRRLLEPLEEDNTGVRWITAYVESLAQKRRDRAPIDEPTTQWLLELIALLKQSGMQVE